MMQTIQVIGPRGTLGRAVCEAALRHDMIAMETDHDIRTITPDGIFAPVVINCAGIVKDRPDKTTSEMIEVNSSAPHQLSHACDLAGTRLIHVSTDCVFQGPGPHDEQQWPDAFDLYAMSKHVGEIVYSPHLTIRTSFVGVGKRGLVTQLLRGDTVRVSKNLLWTGHTVDTVADILIALALRPQITGLLHIPGEEQSRAGLVDRLQSHLGTNAPVIRDDTFCADRRLVSNRWATECGDILIPPFAAQLEGLRRP